jgi:HD-GYP domain-containing protein (c-di-GMP phosphodiesterase class II)
MVSEKANDLNTLNLILQKLEWVKSSSEFFDLVVGLCAQVTGSDEAYFHVYDEAVDKVSLVASFETGTSKSEFHADKRWAIDKVAAKGISEGTAFLMKDCGPCQGFGLPVRSVIGTPLKIREKVFGILTAVLAGDGKRAFSEKEVYYCDFIAKRAGFLIENIALYENIYENLFATLYAFVEAIEAKDPYTKQHSNRVAELAVMIGDRIGVSSEELDLLNFSGHLHDIGKIGIRDNILMKPGRLSREEYTAIKAHPIIGANIIGHLGLMSEEQRIVRYHHERWDGKGYPDGLLGEKIPFLSRILAVADTYDAMASDRAYRKRIERDLIIQTIQQNAGKQFDPQVVDAFMSAQKGGKMTSKEGFLTLSHKKPRVVNLESNPFDGRSVNT